MLAALMLALPTVAPVGGFDPKIDQVIPNCASPGDLVIILGSDLQNTVAVEFSAFVGGFVGFSNVQVAPISVSSNLVLAIVPTMAGFAPPDAVPPGNPFGAITVDPIFQDGVSFYFMQGSNGLVETYGTASTQPSGDRAILEFDFLGGGEPVSPNPNFVMELERGQPNNPALLAIGAPGSLPLPQFSDGTLAINLVAAFQLFGPFATDANGRISAPLPIPAGFSNVSAALQWVLIDPVTLAISISNGIRVNY